MNTIKKSVSLLLCIVLAISFAFTLSSCAKRTFQLSDSDIIKEPGKISSTPYFAKYNSNGTFVFRIAVYNGTEYTKILTSVDVDTLQDQNGKDIVEECNFTVDEAKYLEPGKTDIIQFDYEKEQVLLNTSLNQLTSKVSLNYFGCVKNGKEPEKTDTDGFTASIIDAEVTETGALDGTISIRNNYKTDKTPKTISFDIYTDTGKKVNLKSIVKTNDQPIKAGQTLSLSLGITSNDVDADFSVKKEFDTLVLKELKFSE